MKKPRERATYHISFDQKDMIALNKFGKFVESKTIFSQWELNCEAREIAVTMIPEKHLQKVGVLGINVLAALIYHSGLNVRGREGALQGKFTCDTPQTKIAALANCKIKTVRRKIKLLGELRLLSFYQVRERYMDAVGDNKFNCHTNRYTIGPEALRQYWSKHTKALRERRTKNTAARMKQEAISRERLEEVMAYNKKCREPQKSLEEERGENESKLARFEEAIAISVKIQAERDKEKWLRRELYVGQ